MKLTKKALAMLMTLALILYSLPLTAQADSGCSHDHDADCGYIAGADCGYVHEHDENCGYDEETGSVCTDAHEHDELCGYIKAADCGHVHDEDCGNRNPADDSSLGETDNVATPATTGPQQEPKATMGGEIIAFEPLDENIARQTVPLGTPLEDLTLPDTLMATVLIPASEPDEATPTESGEPVEETIPVPVTWESVPEYDSDTADTYVFSPAVNGFAANAALPVITVAVNAAVTVTPAGAGGDLFASGLLEEAVVTLNPSSAIYNGKNRLDDMTVSVTLDDETLDLSEDYTVKYTLDGTQEINEFRNADTYYVVVTGIGAYSGEKKVSFTIEPVTLTIKGFNITKEYDGTKTVTDFGTLTFEGLVSGEVANVETSGVTATYNNENVGSGKPISFSGNFTLASSFGAYAENYDITPPTGIVGSITHKPVTIIPDSGQSKIYRQDDPTLTFTTDPEHLIGGDSITGALSRDTGDNAGTYNYTLGSLSASSNYKLTLDNTIQFEIRKISVKTIVDLLGPVTKTAFEAKDAITWDKIAELALPPSVKVTLDNDALEHLPVTWGWVSGNYNPKGAVYSFEGMLEGGQNIEDVTTSSVMVTILPVTATNPTFADAFVTTGFSDGSATAAELEAAGVLPTSGDIDVLDVPVPVPYTVAWTEAILDTSVAGNSVTYNGVVDYPGSPWLTLPASDAVSRIVKVTDKTPVTISGITANANLVYDKTAKDVNKASASAGAAGTGGLSYEYVGVSGTSYAASAIAPTNVGDYTCTVTLDDPLYSAPPLVINFTITPKQLTAWDSTSVSVTPKSYDGNTTATVTGTLKVDGVIAGDTVNLTGGTMTAVYDNASAGLGKTVTVTPVGYTTTNGNYLLPPSGTTFALSGDIIGLVFTGSVSISNTAPRVGDVLTANVTETSSAGSHTYLWSGAGSPKNAQTYTVVAADVGQSLTVTVGTSNPSYMGTIVSPATQAVAGSNFTISFNPNGGTGTMSPDTVPNGSSYTIKTNAFTRADYTFSGWRTTASGGTFYAAGATIPSVTANITLYAQWTYTGGSGSGGDSSGSSSDGGLSRWMSTLQTSPEQWLEQALAGRLAASANEQSQDYVRTHYTGVYGVRGNAWAKFAGLRYEHDTIDGNSVQVRLYVNDPTRIKKDTFVSGHIKGSEVDKIKSHFEQWFKNKLRVVHLDQQGDWGQPVNVAARIDLNGMDTTNLAFYAYDKATNSYRQIKQPAYWIDKNGYLHFTTEHAGDIIICEGPLEKK